MNAIFVYGLLKPGLRLHHVAEPFVVRAEPATVRGRLYDAGVPAARFDHEGEIEGFVLWLDRDRTNEALRILDELEDEGDEYRRVLVDARIGAPAERDGATPRSEGVTVAAFAYEYLRSLDGCPYVGPCWPA